tara:strand:+ start:86630 stop:87115 length:486 start_codon:yes stop_codon:yes gene_type:complete
MKPDIRVLQEKKLLGRKKNMSYSKNTTRELWQSFMPLKKHIRNNIDSNLYSLQIYNSDFNFNNFTPQKEFIKWAAIEVPDYDSVPDELETYILQGGLYAVFFHKGTATEFHKTFAAIFTDWLPNSDYDIDHRAHFELLGENYSNTDPISEEEIWIPIKLKK